MKQQRDFPNAARSVGAARHYVLGALAGTHAADLPDIIDVIGVLVSELATNCVLHARTPFTVAVDGSDDAVRVDVTDHGEGTPAVRRPAPREESGRGLQLVQAFADHWGVTRLRRGHGKTVWFTMDLPGPQQESTQFASLGA
jgi:anti-sigma regulatory factor (Ser/Thr protein kinase)